MEQTHPTHSLDIRSTPKETRGDYWVKNRYNARESMRDRALDKARSVARLSLPFLYTPDGHQAGNPLPQPNSSVAAQGFLRLAAKILQTTYPASCDFFKSEVMPFIAKDTAGTGELKQAMDTLVFWDSQLRSILRTLKDRQVYYHCILHTLVAGSSLFFKPNLEEARLYTLDDFVLISDGAGSMVECIVRNKMHPSAFTEDHLKSMFGLDLDGILERGYDEVEVYVRCFKNSKGWRLETEAHGKLIKDMSGDWPIQSPPFIHIPFFKNTGNSYATGYGEIMYGDIAALEETESAKNHMSHIAAQSKLLINANTNITPAMYQDAHSKGTPIYYQGSEARVDPFQFMIPGVAQNLQQLNVIAQEQSAKLGAAFLSFLDVRRQGERVTRDEVMLTAAQLDEILVGFFTELTSSFQRPYLELVTYLAVKADKLEELPKGMTKVELTAGLESIQNNADALALDALLGRLAQFTPDALARVNVGELLTRMAAQQRVPLSGLIRSDEEMQAEQQAMQQQQMGQTLLEKAPDTAIGLVQEGLTAEQEQSTIQ